MIENIRGLADHYGCEPSGVGKAIYRATDCGCTFNESEDSVSISGYAEGSDWEGELHTFTYPFDVKAFETQLKLCDDEGCEAWHEANDCEYCGQAGCDDSCDESQAGGIQ